MANNNNNNNNNNGNLEGKVMTLKEFKKAVKANGAAALVVKSIEKLTAEKVAAENKLVAQKDTAVVARVIATANELVSKGEIAATDIVEILEATDISTIKTAIDNMDNKFCAGKLSVILDGVKISAAGMSSIKAQMLGLSQENYLEIKGLQTAAKAAIALLKKSAEIYYTENKTPEEYLAAAEKPVDMISALNEIAKKIGNKNIILTGYSFAVLEDAIVVSLPKAKGTVGQPQEEKTIEIPKAKHNLEAQGDTSDSRDYETGASDIGYGESENYGTDLVEPLTDSSSEEQESVENSEAKIPTITLVVPPEEEFEENDFEEEEAPEVMETIQDPDYEEAPETVISAATRVIFDHEVEGIKPIAKDVISQAIGKWRAKGKEFGDFSVLVIRPGNHWDALKKTWDQLVAANLEPKFEIVDGRSAITIMATSTPETKVEATPAPEPEVKTAPAPKAEIVSTPEIKAETTSVPEPVVEEAPTPEADTEKVLKAAQKEFYEMHSKYIVRRGNKVLRRDIKLVGEDGCFGDETGIALICESETSALISVGRLGTFAFVRPIKNNEGDITEYSGWVFGFQISTMEALAANGLLYEFVEDVVVKCEGDMLALRPYSISADVLKAASNYQPSVVRKFIPETALQTKIAAADIANGPNNGITVYEDDPDEEIEEYNEDQKAFGETVVTLEKKLIETYGKSAEAVFDKFVRDINCHKISGLFINGKGEFVFTYAPNSYTLVSYHKLNFGKTLTMSAC